MPPYPPRLSARSSSTSTVRPAVSPALATASANAGGRRSLGGVLTQSRVRVTARATTGARRVSARTARSLASGTYTVTAASGSFRGPGAVLYPANRYAPISAPSASARTLPPSSAGSSATGNASSADRVPARVRAAAPAARRSVSAGGSAPAGSGPSPTATTSRAVIVPSVASLVTSPAAPVAPSSARVSTSRPSKAAAMVPAPAASSSGTG